MSLTLARLRRLERVRRLEEEQRRQRFAAAAMRLRRAEECMERQREALGEIAEFGRAVLERGERGELMLAEGVGCAVQARSEGIVAERDERRAELEPEREAYVASRREREQTTRMAERAAELRRVERERRAERAADEWSAQEWFRQRRR